MRGLAIFVAACLALALALGGTAPFGRVLLAAGAPELAAPFFKAPEWLGVARYRAGDMDGAAVAFKDAGETFNLGNTHARRGQYAAALESYDLTIARGDTDAQANFDVVTAFYAGLLIEPDAAWVVRPRGDGPEEESFVARGNARTAGTGDEVTNTNTMMGLAELQSRGRLSVRRIFDDKFMVADDRWLEQLADVPGEYLAARIAQEHKRRAKLGLSPPEPEDPR